MTKREPYNYTVLRYVHDVLTGEFVNVGLVMLIPGSPLIFHETRKTFSRIKDVFPDLDSDAYKEAMRSIDRSLKNIQKNLVDEGFFKENKNAGDYARIALPPDDSSLQWSPSGSGLTINPEKTFNELFSRYITYYNREKSRLRNDRDLWRIVDGKLKDKNIDIPFESKKISSDIDQMNFDHVWKNGRLNVLEPLSFDLSDQDNIKNKARRYFGHISAVKPGFEKLGQDVKLSFIICAPSKSSLFPAYNDAIKILDNVPFEREICEEEEIDGLVTRLGKEVRQHYDHTGGLNKKRGSMGY